jgi:hypothetical protein
MISNKSDCKILDLRSQEAGVLNVEISPCNSQGVVVTEKDNIRIRNPETDLLDKNVNFLLKINSIKGINPIYEDIFCEFKLFNDATTYKTEVLKGKNTDFKFSKQFTFVATAQV